MRRLPKPQEQLQSYFNDLLIDEYEEPIVCQTPTVQSKGNTAADASTVVTHVVESAPVSVSEPLSLPALDTTSIKVIQEDISHQAQSAYELQQQKLQTLLHSLPPTVATEPIRETPVIAASSAAPTVDTSAYPDAISKIATEQQLLDIAGTTHFAPPAPALTSEWLDNGRPAWAQESFDILLLEVQDIKVAVPLATLGQIHRLNEHLTPLFGQTEWFIGIQKTTMGNIKTIDIAQFIMPERYNSVSKVQHQYVVAIDGTDWGFAVDDIDQPIHINPSDIRWRANRSDRVWMAGTVKEHTCILLDIPALGETFVEKSKANSER